MRKASFRVGVIAVSLILTTLGGQTSAQDDTTDALISPATVSNLAQLGNFNPVEENSFYRIEWLSDSRSSFAVFGRRSSGVWIFDATNTEAEPLHLSGSGTLSSDGRYWAVPDVTEQESRTLLFDTETGSLLRAFEHAQLDYINALGEVTFDPSSTLIAATGSSESGVISVWNIKTGDLITIITTPHRINTLTFNFDGSLLAAGLDDATVGVWDSHTGEMVANVGRHINVVYPHFVSSDNRLLISSIDRTVSLWDINSEERLLFMPAHTDLVYAIVTGNGENVVVADATADPDGFYSVIDIWSIAHQRIIATHTLVYNGDGYLIPGGVDFDSKQQSLVFWTVNNEALLINAETGQQLHSFVHTDFVNGAIFSPDDSLIVSWADKLYFWDTGSGELIVSLETEPIQDVIFSPDGTKLITAHVDGSIRLWGIQEKAH